MTCSKALGALGLISVRGLDHPLTGHAFLSNKVITTLQQYCSLVRGISFNFEGPKLCRQFPFCAPIIILQSSVKTTKLIHELEDRRDSFIRLQEEGEQAAATFVSYEDLQNLEQVQRWTSGKVRTKGRFRRRGHNHLNFFFIIPYLHLPQKPQ